jgi:ATP-dependent helicase/nuclease subunit B
MSANGALYLKLGGVDGGESRPVKFGKGIDFVTVAEEHFAGLLTLLNQFADETTPYVPRPFPKFVSRFGAYDHLARVREWSANGGVSEEP